MSKKDKDKANDLSYIKCYTYKQKGHYANKYPKNPRTSSGLDNPYVITEKKTEELE